MKVAAHYWAKPIPDRRFDWQAVDDDTYDGSGCPIGTGATRKKAIADLCQQIEEEREVRFVPCEACGTEGTIYSGTGHDGDYLYADRCEVCQGNCVHEVTVEPVEIEEAQS